MKRLKDYTRSWPANDDRFNYKHWIIQIRIFIVSFNCHEKLKVSLDKRHRNAKLKCSLGAILVLYILTVYNASDCIVVVYIMFQDIVAFLCRILSAQVLRTDIKVLYARSYFIVLYKTGCYIYFGMVGTSL